MRISFSFLLKIPFFSNLFCVIVAMQNLVYFYQVQAYVYVCGSVNYFLYNKYVSDHLLYSTSLFYI